jgi:hypothetical protein
MRVWSWITGVITTVSLLVAPIISTVNAVPIANSVSINYKPRPNVESTIAYNNIARRNIVKTKKYCESDDDCYHSGTCLMSSDGSWSVCQCKGDIWSGGKCQYITNLWQCKQDKKTKTWTLEINQGEGYKISEIDCKWIDTEYSKILGSDMLRCVNTADGQQKFIYNSFKTVEKAQREIDKTLIWAHDMWEAFQVLSDVESNYPGTDAQALTVVAVENGRYKIQSLPMDNKLCNYWETILESATLSVPNKCITTPGLCANNEDCIGSLSEYHCILSNSE